MDRNPYCHLRPILCLIAAALISGCGGGTSSEGPSSPVTPLPSRILSWSPPTAYTDSTPLDPARDLSNFEIYVNETGSFTDADAPAAIVAAVDPATQAVTTDFDLANLAPYVRAGVAYRVALRSVATTGARSGFSATAGFSF